METQFSTWTCDSSHLKGLITLGESYFPQGNPALSAEFLKWSYIDNPAGPATLIIAHEDGVYIGMMALLPIMIERDGQSYKACIAVNALTHPEHRKKNLFLKILKYTCEYASANQIWLLAHPNANAFPAWKRSRMMFREPLQLHLAKFGCPFSGKRVRQIKSLDELKALPAAFWDKLSKKSDVHVKYTPEYVAWRFLDAPLMGYVVSAVEKKGELLGLRVTRHFKWMVDLMVDFIAPDDTLGAVMSSVYKPTLILHSGSGGMSNEVKKGAWFVPYKRTFPFFITTWAAGLESDDMNGITLAASDF